LKAVRKWPSSGRAWVILVLKVSRAVRKRPGEKIVTGARTRRGWFR
jgi:hypothetical protein